MPKFARNEECIVRDRPCGRVFGGSRMCFVASPSADEVGLELGVISSVLAEERIEPYVAVEHYEPAKEIFCTKICTKIIESRLCVVLLSGAGDDRGDPNPNIHYEYGMMTAWGKPTIPVQRERQQLAFNIQSLDTVKYTPRTFEANFRKAFETVASQIEEADHAEDEIANVTALLCYYMEMCGHGPIPSTFVSGTSFLSFWGWRFAVVLSPRTTIERVVVSAKLLFRRLESYTARLQRDLDVLQERIEEEKAKRNISAVEGLTRQHEQKRSLLDRARVAEVLIVDAAEQGVGLLIKDELAKLLAKLSTALSPSLVVLTQQELHNRLQEL